MPPDPYPDSVPEPVPTAHFELGNDGPSLIVAGVDGSDSSMRAASYAAGLARRQGSHLVVVYVAQRSGLAGQDAQAAAAFDSAQRLEIEELQTTLDQGREHYGLSAELQIRIGDPTRELTQIADDLHADAVVVGTSVKHGHNLVGSTGLKLAKAAHWPVTIVP